MTAQSIDYKHSKIKLKSAIITLAAVCAFAIFFVESDVIIERMKNGLELVGGVIIPTLFPYMVLSEIIILSGIGDLIERMLGDAFSRIFNLPKCCASAFILGILCGFPVGTKIAYSLYEKGKITDAELLRLLMFCNIQSISFIVNTVGGSLLGSRSAGIALYVTQVISAIIIGLILSKINTNKCYNATRPIQVKSTKNSFADSITASVKSGVSGILGISGFVLFFYVLCGIVMDLPMPTSISLALCGMLEMSCGCVEMARNLTHITAFLSCSAVLGFSGISLHFQIMSLCKNVEIKYEKIFMTKILTAAIAVSLTIVLNFIFKIFP